jgi:xanthine dehydrogenase accessory factor
MAELVSQRVPFVHATVVRAQHPTSARPGDQAIVLADGSIEGFVGGHCARGSVRTAALGVLRGGESVLLRVLPDNNDAFPESPGASVVVNPCLSGGALEIFLEPQLPSPLLHLVGDTPTADAVAALAETVGFVISRATHASVPDDALAAIVSSHGGDEAGAIRRALDVGTPYVGLVASKTRGDALLDEIGLSEGERSRVHTPVGIDIGARTPQEIALSIVAELVRAVRRDGLAAADETAAGSSGSTETVAPATAVDPVCGMSVTILSDTPHLHRDSEDFWFCGVGCRDAYQRSH